MPDSPLTRMMAKPVEPDHIVAGTFYMFGNRLVWYSRPFYAPPERVVYHPKIRRYSTGA